MLVKTSRLALAEARNAANPGSDTYTLVGATVKLWKAGPTPTPQSKLSDFTICDFSGYADETTTFNPPFLETDGSATTISGLNIFAANDTVTTNTVIGSLVVFGNDSTALAAASQFDTPIPMTAPGDGFGLVHELNCGGASPNTEEIVIS